MTCDLHDKNFAGIFNVYPKTGSLDHTEHQQSLIYVQTILNMLNKVELLLCGWLAL